MLSIENQIAAVQGILKDGYYRESDATLIESILSSLERLRDAESTKIDNERELPPLPKEKVATDMHMDGKGFPAFSSEQMREYARAAMLSAAQVKP